MASYAQSSVPRSHGTQGDILFDNQGNVYSIGSINNMLEVLRLTPTGGLSYEQAYGVSGGTVQVRQAVITQDSESIYITGSATGNSLTGSSGSSNIFLHKIKATDGTTGWTRHWGLTGNDVATGITVNPDGGKILVVG
jgi:hypothetical protein